MTKQASQGLDLASLDTVAACNKGFELELLHPSSRKPLGMFITIYGKDSEVYNDIVHERINTTIRKRALEMRTGKDADIKTSQQIDEEEIELLVGCTISFRDINFNGPYEYSIANAIKLYKQMPWIKDQVNRAIADISNFI